MQFHFPAPGGPMRHPLGQRLPMQRYLKRSLLKYGVQMQ
jgi:hypothetical protein